MAFNRHHQIYIEIVYANAWKAFNEIHSMGPGECLNCLQNVAFIYYHFSRSHSRSFYLDANSECEFRHFKPYKCRNWWFFLFIKVMRGNTSSSPKFHLVWCESCKILPDPNQWWWWEVGFVWSKFIVSPVIIMYENEHLHQLDFFLLLLLSLAFFLRFNIILNIFGVTDVVVLFIHSSLFCCRSIICIFQLYIYICVCVCVSQLHSLYMCLSLSDFFFFVSCRSRHSLIRLLVHLIIESSFQYRVKSVGEYLLPLGRMLKQTPV